MCWEPFPEPREHCLGRALRPFRRWPSSRPCSRRPCWPRSFGRRRCLQKEREEGTNELHFHPEENVTKGLTAKGSLNGRGTVGGVIRAALGISPAPELPATLSARHRGALTAAARHRGVHGGRERVALHVAHNGAIAEGGDVCRRGERRLIDVGVLLHSVAAELSGGRGRGRVQVLHAGLIAKEYV